MESRHLFDRYSTRHHHRHRQQNQQLRHGQLASQQSLGLSDYQGIEDAFAQMNLADEVGNASSPRLLSDNLVLPRSDLGLSSTNHNHLLYQNNGVYGNCELNHPYGGVNRDFESSIYRAELERMFQMNEFWRRHNNAVPNRLSISPYTSRNGSGVSSRPAGVVNRVVANGNNNEVNLKDLRGRILGLATDQVGCKMLQNKFVEIKEEEIEMILEEVFDKLSSLMMDQFGNYLVQKLIEVCSEEQRTCIVRLVTQTPYQLISICLNLHGTRAVQKLLESLTTDQQISMVISALSPGVVALIKDGNAHHVIQHCLKHFSDEHTMFLVNEIARNCYAIATDKSGCCVLQLCVDITSGRVKDHLISEIVAAALPLSEDCYGNYVVQHLLLMKVPNVTAMVVNKLRGHFFSLACNKYGSNVVEKCLTDPDDECSKLVILELLRTPNVSKLLLDPFGNYVFQSALSASQGVLHNALVRLVEKNSMSMCSNLYGKKVLAWFDNKKRLCHMHQNLHS